MLSLELEMVQYDCPYIDTTDDYEISFLAKQWEFDATANSLETRIMTRAATPVELDRGLEALQEHDNMEAVELLRRSGDTALIRSCICETQAMEAVRDNDGYITGPFEISEGSEMWRIGFDTVAVAERGLDELEQHNDFSVESRESLDLQEYYDVLQNVKRAGDVFDSCRDLSDVERETLITAVEEGYFGQPRDATLEALAEEFDISRTAVSKNLRRSQRKVLSELVEVIDVTHEEETEGTV
ncbi:MAG: helix-turn-helix domain-containing protein [Halobacteriales archaeon SW_9_67_25]|nr:MAG: helix-turn-helix domain-containing protein [Halobacteriales archaeon SW_9_67_25]